MSCHNCGKKGHSFRACPETIDEDRIKMNTRAFDEQRKPRVDVISEADHDLALDELDFIGVTTAADDVFFGRTLKRARRGHQLC